MHQEHNIPWNMLASHVKFVQNDRSFTPPLTGFKSLSRPTQEKDYEFFIQRLASTIHEFAVTERKKYPPTQDLKPPSNGLLFSDELRDKYPEYLNAKIQRLDYWTASERKREAMYGGTYTYYTNHEELENIVKILVHENQMEPLLMLAAHPLVPLHTIHVRCFSRIVQYALDSYIFWNFMSSTGLLASGAYKEIRKYKFLAMHFTQPKAHYVPHHMLYGTIGPEAPIVDTSRLREYLKHIFSLLYRFDMLMMEYGVEENWYESIDSSLGFTGRIRHGHQGVKQEVRTWQRMKKEEH